MAYNLIVSATETASYDVTPVSDHCDGDYHVRLDIHPSQRTGLASLHSAVEAINDVFSGTGKVIVDVSRDWTEEHLRALDASRGLSSDGRDAEWEFDMVGSTPLPVVPPIGANLLQATVNPISIGCCLKKCMDAGTCTCKHNLASLTIGSHLRGRHGHGAGRQPRRAASVSSASSSASSSESSESESESDDSDDSGSGSESSDDSDDSGSGSESSSGSESGSGRSRSPSPVARTKPHRTSRRHHRGFISKIEHLGREAVDETEHLGREAVDEAEHLGRKAYHEAKHVAHEVASDAEEGWVDAGREVHDIEHHHHHHHHHHT